MASPSNGPVCSECGEVLPQGARFCPACGHKVAGTPDPRSGDIRASQVNTHVENQYNMGVGGPVPVLSPAKALESYLGWVVETQSVLRLADIIEGIAAVESRPLELSQVFVGLKTHMRIPKKRSLAAYLRAQQSRGAERKGQSTFFRPGHGRLGGQTGEEPTKFRPVAVFETLSQHRAIVLVGDPGSGKSTVGQFVALALAGAGLGRADLFPQLRMGEGFRPPVPVFLVLRDFAAALDESGAVGKAADVWDHLRATLRACGKPDAWADAVQGAVQERGGWFILDGWDETADPGRLVRVAEAVSELVRNSGKACRFLLTSRFYAWDSVEAALTGRGPVVQDARSVQDAGRFRKALAGLGREFGSRYDVEPLVEPQIREFVAKWYGAIESAALTGISAKEAARKRMDLEVAVAREDLKPVMANPLLLTLTASLSGTHLPDDRADLFDKIVDLLLRRWTEANGAAPSLRERLGREIRQDDIRGKMAECAFEAHRGHVGKDGVAGIPESALLRAFASLLNNDLNAAQEVIQFVQHRAGLLIGKGAPLADSTQSLVRQFACPHRSLQEYLAGCFLANRSTFTASGTGPDSDGVSAVSLARQDPGHWREVLAFAARTAGPDRGSLAASLLVHETPFQEYARNHAVTETDWRCAVVAGHQLLEIAHTAIAGDPSALRRWRLVVGWLAALVEQEGLPSVRERAEAATMLGRLGDSRPGVAPAWPPTAEAPFFAWGKQVVTETEFEMGGDPEPWQWKASRTIRFPATFRLARYPVTNAQYDHFEASAWFAEKGLERRGKNDPRFLGPNKPVVNVSWDDAMHFCEWISGELAAGRVQPEWLGVEAEDLKASSRWHIRLPTEAEWEYAARGPEGRLLPWSARGQEGVVVLSERCNMDETGLGETSAVGLFQQGKSTEDCLDLIGNVWEWTSSRFRTEPEDCADQLIATNGSDDWRVLRGGSWGDDFGVRLRCASRFGYPPDFVFIHVGFRCVLVGGLVAGR